MILNTRCIGAKKSVPPNCTAGHQSLSPSRRQQSKATSSSPLSKWVWYLEQRRDCSCALSGLARVRCLVTLRGQAGEVKKTSRSGEAKAAHSSGTPGKAHLPKRRSQQRCECHEGSWEVPRTNPSDEAGCTLRIIWWLSGWKVGRSTYACLRGPLQVLSFTWLHPNMH